MNSSPKSSSIVIAGLPSSGKTTFLAALWHMLTAPERRDDTALRFSSLIKGNSEHLNNLADCWRAAKTQERTIQEEFVSMNLKDSSDALLTLSFPDLSGESFKMMWEERDCAKSLAEVLINCTGLLLFINADKIDHELLTVDVAEQMRQLGQPMKPVAPEELVKWTASQAPTQVALTDLLQLFKAPPLSMSIRKVAIVFSAWDKVEDDNLTPDQYLASKLPLFDQYLQSATGSWDWKTYGVSAQGTDYHPRKESKIQLSPAQIERIAKLYEMDSAIERIKVVSEKQSSDLTKPIAWLLT